MRSGSDIFIATFCRTNFQLLRSSIDGCICVCISYSEHRVGGAAKNKTRTILKNIFDEVYQASLLRVRTVLGHGQSSRISKIHETLQRAHRR